MEHEEDPGHASIIQRNSWNTEFYGHYHKQQNGVLQCIEISNACETRKYERFITI